jgi:pSer/pThr/pTyr-binding forkhead associated (FHA) protein
MAGAKIPLTFRIFKGDQLVREETLTQPVIKVGKLSSSHLRLDDDTVSRMHAVIEVTGPGDVSIIDLGSTKGTFVNGQKVNKAKLQSGDQVVLGDTRIEVTIGAAGAEAHGDDEDEAPTRVNVAPAEPAQAPSPVMASAPRPDPNQPAPAPAPTMGDVSSGGPGAPAQAHPPAASPMASQQPPLAAPPPQPPMPGNFAPPPGMGGPATGAAAPAPQFGADSFEDMGGARAIEVAAMLGDSVVGVKHVSEPRGGKVTPVTYGLFATGAALLLMSAIAFGVAVSNAGFNIDYKRAWVEDQKRPAWEWRPRRISLAYDWMAFGGMFGGLFCMTYGLVRFRNEKKSPFFRIGNAAGVDFPTSDAPAADFPLVAPLGDDFVFNFGHGMEGEMMLDGQSVSLAELQAQGRARPSSTAPGATEVPIPPKARFRVKVAGQTLLVSSVPQPRRQAAPLFATVESRALAYFAGSAIVHMGFWALLRTIPPDPGLLVSQLGSGEALISRVDSKANEDDKPEEEDSSDEDSGEEEGGTGTAEALEEGKMGKKDSDRAEGRYAIQDRGMDPQLAKKKALEEARTAGIVGHISAMEGGFSTFTGNADVSSGFDDADVFGGRLGDEVGEMQGGFGTGVAGFGPGGGGTGWGTIGSGRYGTIGHGSGTGDGYGTGGGRGGMRGRKAVTPKVHIGNAIATGDLDKNIIRRYIRRKLPQIKYCYEKQLLVNQGLSGTVVSEFNIMPDGSVKGSKASGVNDTVSSCVAGVIGTIQFPKPKGAGLVKVRYPFTFRSN